MKINQAELDSKKQVLDNAKKELKAYFIGIDHIIDDLMDYIQIWYLIPELLSRPVIVNLWGMTGVGKTDLIRRLVKLLNFQDRFLEIELSNVDSTNFSTSVSAILSAGEMNDDKPSILLFDEIQRFNTIEIDGRPLPQTKFMDFWELLSDGKLSKKTRDNLDSYLVNFKFNKKYAEERKKSGEENVDMNPILNYWEADALRKMLGLDADIDEMMTWTQDEMMKILVEEKKKKTIYEPIDHSKTLIIISGNLDEAFSIAHKTSETDLDADIFYTYTKNINLVDIKNALSRKFRPEQVARFGNIHLIYTSLRTKDFEELIKREVSRVTNSIKDKFDIKLNIDHSMNTLIYQNGVFPVQGVRPVFSSVIDILEANLSKYLFKAITTNKKTITIKYDFDKSKIVATVGSESIETPYVGRIDKIREANLEDTIANISVHEAGHAVAYIVIFNLAPLQLKSKIASSYASGFTFSHQIYDTKATLLSKIKIFLAGGIAEEIVFGKDNASVGRSSDRTEATILAIDFVRRHGFDSEFQANYTLDAAYSLDKDITDTDIEKMITQLVSETQQLLSDNKNLLIAISKDLMKKGTLEATEVATIAKAFGFNIVVEDEDYMEIPKYAQKLLG
jgi:Peptidase family M41/ATPase family associated with various cellular activities (AAA)